MYTLDWILRDDSGIPFELISVDLNHARFTTLEGIYVIWYQDLSSPITVYVGQGMIKDRLYVHRSDNRIRSVTNNTLYVVWAKETSKDYRDGIEAYLHQILNPMVGERTPDVNPIFVNPPWN